MRWKGFTQTIVSERKSSRSSFSQVEFLDSRRHRVEDYEDQLDTLRVQDAEEYNMVKIKLETDVQVFPVIHAVKRNVHDNRN